MLCQYCQQTDTAFSFLNIMSPSINNQLVGFTPFHPFPPGQMIDVPGRLVFKRGGVETTWLEAKSACMDLRFTVLVHAGTILYIITFSVWRKICTLGNEHLHRAEI